MNREEIFSNVLAESNSDIKTTEELEAMLDKELSKSEDKIDFELVNELSVAIIEARGDKEIKVDVDEKLKEFEAMKKSTTKRFRIPKWSVGLAAACVMIMCANVISVSAWNMNIFSLIVEFTKGGATIDFSETKEEEIVLPTSEDDLYGIIGECNKLGITVETPHYIPDGFILTEMESEDTDDRKYIGMVYKNDNQLINFTFESYTDGLLGIPSDEHNLSEFTINGHTAIMSKEDNQMIVVFRSGDFYVTISTKNVDYHECDNILNSIN